MSDYTLSTPEGRAEVRRMCTSFKNMCTCEGYVHEIDGRSATHPHMAWCPQYIESSLLLAALDEIERLKRGLADNLVYCEHLRHKLNVAYRKDSDRLAAMHAATQDICEAAGVDDAEGGAMSNLALRVVQVLGVIPGAVLAICATIYVFTGGDPLPGDSGGALFGLALVGGFTAAVASIGLAERGTR